MARAQPAMALPPVPAFPEERPALNLDVAPPEEPPRTVHRARPWLIAGGLATFGLTWGAAALLGHAISPTCDDNECRKAADRMWIPVAGPTLGYYTLGNQRYGDIAVLWSLVQAAGVTVTIFGIIGHDVPAEGDGRTRASLDIELVPTRTSETRGLALRATF